MLKFGLHARFNHLFRCIEPRITSQLAPALDKWFFEQVCIVAGEHWNKDDKELAAHYCQPMCFGGSGMGSFVDLVHVAYVASWIDCIFPKGVSFNGNRPIGTKSIIKHASGF